MIIKSTQLLFINLIVYYATREGKIKNAKGVHSRILHFLKSSVYYFSPYTLARDKFSYEKNISITVFN